MGTIAENGFIHLPAVTVRLGMNDSGVVVNMLISTANGKSVERAFNSFPIEVYSDIVPYCFSAQAIRAGSEGAVLFLVDSKI